MKCGIVGLPNVGKSTLFNCLSRSKALAANYPFATIDPNVGIIPVPDKRLDKLSKLFNPQNTLSATVEIVDIAGLVKGASKGEGLGNKFLANIRETDAIIHVLRCFDNDNIVHVDGSINPIRDKETIDIELQLKDLETIEKKIEKTFRLAKTGNKEAQKEILVLEKVKNELERSNNVRSINFSMEDRKLYITPLQLITEKPVLYVCNVSEADVVKENSYVSGVKELIANEKAEIMYLAVSTEADINDLDSYEERKMFLDDLGLEEPGVSRLIRKTYKLLNLQTYFTAGEKEVRAWTIPVGSSAPQSAGVIHSDFEKGFIKAEVISFEDLINFGSELKVREAGKIRVEGKEYILQDGDVMHFRFNT